MELTPNLVVAGRFRLNHLIGQGGMGSVWHATHLGLDVPCAVKFIDGSVADIFVAQARFTREARAAAQLRSPHVVQILDHGVHDGTPYIAMELLDGEDMGTRIARKGRLSPAETYAILHQVCRALTKAHGLGIVHRDLKPENIFLVRDDDREIAKVLDFGIAKLQVAERQGLSGTKTGAMLGTPFYMSPEQAQGTKTVDARSDLWSVAVIAFQAITGRLPFDSEALGDLVLKIVVGDIPVPSQHAPVPPGFDAWWARAVTRDPAGRFQSARELSEGLAVACQVTAEGLSTSGTDLPAFAASSSDGAVREGAVSAEGTLPDGVKPYARAKTPATMGRTLADGPRSGAAHRSRLLAGVAGVVGALALVAIATALFFARSSRVPVTAASASATDAPPSAAPTMPSTTVAAVAPPPPPSAQPSSVQPGVPPTGTVAAPRVPPAVSPHTPAPAPPPKPAPKPKPANPRDLGF